MAELSGHLGMEARPHPLGFGAEVLCERLTADRSAACAPGLRRLLADFGVIWLPDQAIDLDELEALTRALGGYGEDPFIAPMPDRPHVLEVRREPEERASVFGGAWHSDWSFQPSPPSATLLLGMVIPPVGGDTLFADGARAFAALPPDLQARLLTLEAVHTADGPYGENGYYAREGERRSMTVLAGPAAAARQRHPLVRRHPDSGLPCLFVNPIYTAEVAGLDPEDSRALLARLYAELTDPAHVLRLKWREGMLAIWDNRRVVHNATGGYDGHRRLMRRTVVRGEVPEPA